MNCPQCAQSLQIQSSKRFAHAYTCAQGHGLGLGFGLLKENFEPAPFLRLWTQARVSAEGPQCPSCRHPMRISELGVGDDHVVLDLCKICYFVWLDPGELDALDALKARHPEVFRRTDPGAEAQRLAAVRAFSQPPLVADEPQPKGHLGVAMDRADQVGDVLDLLSAVGDLLDV